MKMSGSKHRNSCNLAMDRIGLAPFKIARPLPIGDDVVVGFLLDSDHVEIVPMDLITEEAGRKFAVFPAIDRFVERLRDSRITRCPVAISFELSCGLDL